jgi:hypothetical protein
LISSQVTLTQEEKTDSKNCPEKESVMNGNLIYILLSLDIGHLECVSELLKF